MVIPLAATPMVSAVTQSGGLEPQVLLRFGKIMLQPISLTMVLVATLPP